MQSKMKLKKLKDLGCLTIYEQKEENQIFNYAKSKNSELHFVEIKSSKDYKAKELDKYKKYKNDYIMYFKGCLTQKGNIYCPYEYCNGKNLDRFVENFCGFKNTFFVNELYIQDIIKKIVKGLEYLHKNKIIHGGLSFENIWINFKEPKNIITKDEIERIKMSEELIEPDNIIPKIHYFLCPKDQKKNIENLNTMKYLSPEVLDDIIKKKEIKFNASGDIWSLGIITYKLLTRQFPFDGINAEGIKRSINNGKLYLPENSLYSLEILKFIKNILTTDPKNRLTLDKIKEEDFIKNLPEKFTFVKKTNDMEIFLNCSDDFIRWICLKDTGIEVKEIAEKEKLLYLQSELLRKIGNIAKEQAEYVFELSELKYMDQLKYSENEKKIQKLNSELQKLDIQLKKIAKQLEAYN